MSATPKPGTLRSGGHAKSQPASGRNAAVRRPRSRIEMQRQAERVAQGLLEAVPEPRCELEYRNPFELLVATILSAQSTDKGVNRVTPALFAAYPDARALASAEQATLERLIHSTGFFRQKAKNLRETARLLVERYDGAVPSEMNALLKLPGVARKTAAVVLGTAFGIAEGIPVDTHATRVSRRLGLTRHSDPRKIEADLMKLFPRAGWPDLGHRIVLFGRYVCTARSPACRRCPMLAFCPAVEARAARA